jgi:myo-inositol-1(or 4)-monophosphatase
MKKESSFERKLPPEYRDLAIDIAHQAGEIIRDKFKLGMGKEWKEGKIVSPVTETDLAINELVIRAIKERFPDHGIIGEERSEPGETNEDIWVCDPVDGTTPFSHGVPTCVFSLALTRDGESLLGVVYDPFMDRLFVAERGSGASLNGSPIRVSAAETIARGVIGVELPPVLSHHFPQLRNELVMNKAKILTVGSTIYMGALVACGEFVANIFTGDKPHDAAALKILVEEAGGKVTDIWGDEQRLDRDIKGFLATNGLVHEELLDLIRENAEKSSH